MKIKRFVNIFNYKIVRSSAIYTVSNFAVASVPFILLPILTRILSPEEYGVISMFTLVVAYLTIFVGLNIHGAISVRYFDQSNYDMKKYVSGALFIAVLMATCMFALIKMFGAKIELFTGVPKPWLFAAACVSLCQFVTHVMLVIWQITNNALSYSLLRIAHALIDAVLSLIFIYFVFTSWHGRTSGILLAWILIAIAAFIFIYKKGWVVRKLDLDAVKDALKFGVPLMPHSLGALILSLSDRILINSLIDTSATGLYVVAAQIGLVLNLLADSINKAYAPWLMEKLKHRNEFLFKRIVLFTYGYFLSIFCVALVASTLSKLLLDYIVSAEYLIIKEILIYIFLGNAFTGMYFMVTNYIFYSRRTLSLSILTISCGLVTFVLNWILINFLGIKGAAIGFMLGQMILFFGAWLLAHRSYKMPWRLNLGDLRINEKR